MLFLKRRKTMQISKIFYNVKYKNNCKITRILCFKFKKTQPPIITPHWVLKPPVNGYKVLTIKNHTGPFLRQANINISNCGKWSYTQGDLYCVSPNTTIGAFCSLGCRIVLGHGEHPTEFLSASPYFYFKELGWKNDDMPTHSEFWNISPIHIGNDVWIGDGVFVKNGVTIGDGAIIGARSVVTKDVPPYAIVVGCPARVLRYRFSPEIISQLLELKWWNLDDELIKRIPYDNIEKAIEFIKEVRGKL